jgi:hypothetical protein
MKAFQAILILCLVASFTCFDLITFITCLLGNQNIMNFGNELIEKITSGEDVWTIIWFALGQIGNIIDAIKACNK